MSKDGRNNTGYVGPDTDTFTKEPPGRAFDVLITCLYLLDPNMFTLVLQRFLPGAPVPGEALTEPWRLFTEVIRKGVDDTEALVRERFRLQMSNDVVFTLQGDFRQMATAILAYTLSEKESGQAPVEGENVRTMFCDCNRAKTLMEWLDAVSSPTLHGAVLSLLLRQCETLQSAFPQSWQTMLDREISSPDLELVECVHDRLWNACDVIFSNAVPWPRLRNEWVKPGRTLQDEASLLTVALVAMYHLYGQQPVRQRIGEASKMVLSKELFPGLSRQVLESGDPNPPPRAPPTGRGNLRVVK